jgi:chromosome segregation ATPase
MDEVLEPSSAVASQAHEANEAPVAPEANDANEAHRAAEANEAPDAGEVAEADEAPAAHGAAEVSEPPDANESAEAGASGALDLPLDKKRLEDQLEALKRKERELRRAIVIADHPGLAEAIRQLEGRAFALSRAEAKLAQGLSKSEARRKETLEKKLATLRAKRAELDGQIDTLDAELRSLVEARTEVLEGERQRALRELVATLGEHTAALTEAGLEAGELVPEIDQRMDELRAVAEELVAARARADG